MSCQPYADAIVDSSIAAPPDLKGHLAGCADCRALASGHAAAVKLGGLELPPVRARRVVPRRVAVAAVALLAAVGLATLRDEAPRPVQAPVDDASSDEWAAFATLHQETSSYARADADALGNFHDVQQYFALERLSSRSEALSESTASQESP